MRSLLLCLLLALPCAAFAEASWLTELESALKAAQAAKKPVLIDFQAPWCYSCYYMDSHVLSREPFAQAAKGLVLLKLDVDTEAGRALKEKYGVTFLPSYVVIDEKGAALGRIIGEQTEQDFLSRLDAVLKTSGRDPLAQAEQRLGQRLAAGEFSQAASEVAKLPAPRLKELRKRVSWRVLAARLALRQAEKAQDPAAAAGALETILKEEQACDLAYDVGYSEKVVDALPPERRLALLGAERDALESLVSRRVMSVGASRCADFRSGIETLAEVYAKLGEKERRAGLLSRANAFLERQDVKPGVDRNHDDNRRFFLELAGEDAKLQALFIELVAAYPADYVYRARFAKHLLEKGEAALALDWAERADQLAYGANRLSVTKTRAKALAALGRKEEALALLRRDIKAGSAVFAKDVRGLEELAAELK
ncbi:MAG: thioredoxin family protein [Elusimicrobiota bacterium]